MECMHSLAGEETLCNERKVYTTNLLYTLSHVSMILVMLQTEPNLS